MARDLNLMSERDFTTMLANIVEERMMLYGLLKTLRARDARPRAPDNRTVRQSDN